MQVAPQIFFLSGLFLVLSSLLHSVALAIDRNPQPLYTDGQSLPAVDGLNAKADAFGGEANGRAFFGGTGSVTVPLGFRYGLQIDGLVAGFDSQFQGDVTVGATAGHLFWRDPAVGHLGIYGHYVHADAFGGVDFLAGAGEGALYLGRFTLEGLVGVEGGEVEDAFGSFDIATRFFDMAHLSYYPTDNLKLSVGHSYILGEHAAWFGAEWGFGTGGGTMSALYAQGSIDEDGDGVFLGGLRIYFGQHDKTLIRRQREDDPMSSLGTYAGQTNGSTRLTPQ
jgi:hypothetical protein